MTTRVVSTSICGDPDIIPFSRRTSRHGIYTGRTWRSSAGYGMGRAEGVVII